MATYRARLARTGLAGLAALALLAGCARGEDAAEGGGSPEPADQGPSLRAADGETCTAEQYGVEPFDLAGSTVGFSQSEPEANPFRIAETASIREEAEARGIELIDTNAQGEFSRQISDVQDMIAQGVDLLIIAPLNSDGWEPVLADAAEQGIPIITVDRQINAEPCADYVAFLGSDFVEQGRRAADRMIEALGGEGQVAILLGAPGNNVTTERNQGFVDQIEAEAPGIEIVFEQTGNFSREEGQEVAEQLLQSNPDVDGIYAHNDEMGLGAITALQGAGREPGEVQIVTIDGTEGAVQAIIDGWMFAVIESNPRFGPLAFQAAEQFAAGEEIGVNLVIEDREYTQANAESDIANAY
ncbi:ABC transporter substrate-binding protein [Allonocardiopsis opalescens]|uniref:Monosaccharide ABC transporter substrate-binding protein (CUT2 family) n=1 Tax=Allonocardiopsis opalescens TaxID=1144618 RepID=A0A2T0PYW3_9ACTN|nr:ABC transporter substrate-binding protein [Allonocardiopsis opalescens]PRX96736.1 monosaccharide ABC transporter substrate-binding protein (CUT2 family) [Allonocardiopsis opalescens]